MMGKIFILWLWNPGFQEHPIFSVDSIILVVIGKDQGLKYQITGMNEKARAVDKFGNGEDQAIDQMIRRESRCGVRY
jgi:hypothetical protein